MPASALQRGALVFLCLATTFLSAEIATYSRNTPSKHPEWVNRKQFLSRDLVGASENESLGTRNVLNRNRLNLHAWYGFNEFILNKKLSLGSVRWDCYIGQDSVLYMLFNMDKKTLSGIRFSRDPRLPAIHFRADPKGRFLEKKAILGAVLSDAWHHAELKFGPDSFGLWIDGRLVYEAAEPSLPGRFIGFRSGPNEALVDNVRVLEAGGRRIFSESFRNDRNYWLLAILAAAGAFGTAGLVLYLGGVAGKSPQWAAIAAIVSQFWLAAFCAAYFTFDYLFWSRQYHYEQSPAWVIQGSLPLKRLERWRVRLSRMLAPLDPQPRGGPFRTLPQPVAEILDYDPVPFGLGGKDMDVIEGASPRETIVKDDETTAFIEAAAKSAALKIVYLGTSQLWGAGADQPEDTFVSQAHRRLAEKFGGRSLLSVNASVCGSNSKELLSRYRSLAALKPALVVVDLSNNDSDPVLFAENMRSLLEFNRQRGIKTLLVLEACYREGGLDLRERNHATMIRLGKIYGAPSIDLDAYLAKMLLEDRGFLWWDVVHLTSYGQELAGRFVAEGIRKKFNKLGSSLLPR